MTEDKAFEQIIHSAAEPFKTAVFRVKDDVYMAHRILELRGLEPTAADVVALARMIAEERRAADEDRTPRGQG